jgi:hypothetical protein
VKDFAWVDVRATADPVATGPTLSDTAGLPDDRVVRNLRSSLFDHTSYWANWGGFVPVVLTQIASVSNWAGRGLLEVPAAWRDQQEAARGRRTGWLVLIRLAGVAVIGLMAVLIPPEVLGDRALRALQRPLVLIGVNRIDGLLESPVVTRVIGLIVVSGTFLLVYRLIAALSHWIDGRRRQRALMSLPDIGTAQPSVDSGQAA